jgi:hypothetical protein
MASLKALTPEFPCRSCIVSFHMLQPQPTMSPAARLTFRPKAAEDWTTQESTRSCIERCSGRSNRRGVRPVPGMDRGNPGGKPESTGQCPRHCSLPSPDDAPICNLDDPVVLHTLGLRPSDIVSRDYTRGRARAQRIYEQRGWFGVRWWSYYNSQWASFGLWNFGQLKLEEVNLLRLDDPAFLDASRTIARRIVTHPNKI